MPWKVRVQVSGILVDSTIMSLSDCLGQDIYIGYRDKWFATLLLLLTNSTTQAALSRQSRSKDAARVKITSSSERNIKTQDNRVPADEAVEDIACSEGDKAPKIRDLKSLIHGATTGKKTAKRLARAFSSMIGSGISTSKLTHRLKQSGSDHELSGGAYRSELNLTVLC